MADSGRSPWFWVLSGCGVLLLLAGIAVVVVAVLGWRWAKDIEATFEDPERRTAAVLETLDAEGLPDGWYAGFALPVPFGIVDVAFLTDAEQPDGEGRPTLSAGERAFVYVRLPGGRTDEVRARFERGGDLGTAFREVGFDFDVRRELGQGSLPVRGGTLLWRSGIGTVDFQSASADGLTTVGLIDCDTGGGNRMVAWFGGSLDTDPETDPAALDGSFADPEYLGTFLGHFRLCPE